MYGTTSNYAAILTLLMDEARKDIAYWWYGVTHRREIDAAIKEVEDNPYQEDCA
jgi:hypothetical protein